MSSGLSINHRTALQRRAAVFDRERSAAARGRGEELGGDVRKHIPLTKSKCFVLSVHCRQLQLRDPMSHKEITPGAAETR